MTGVDCTTCLLSKKEKKLKNKVLTTSEYTVDGAWWGCFYDMCKIRDLKNTVLVH